MGFKSAYQGGKDMASFGVIDDESESAIKILEDLVGWVWTTIT